MFRTSPKTSEVWLFKGDRGGLAALAALDRLTHHAHTLTIRGESFRQYNRKKELSSVSE
ncbi:MAG: ATP-binding protein [Chloroflexota bacterium]